MPHRGLVNYLHWCTRAYAMDAGCGAPVHSSIAFDLTITGLFGPLLAGRSVHLVAEDDSVEALASMLRQPGGFSVVKITPAHLSLLASELSPREAGGRALTFVIGGEELRAEHVAFWRTHAPDTVLVNEYGPSETVVGCCTYVVPRDASLPGRIPIGRPIWNTTVYVLDAHLEPVPVGVPGELYIGGDGLARGYLRRPELTGAAFIPHPFSADPEARVYKTGDLVRYLPAGALEFLGRIDDRSRSAASASSPARSRPAQRTPVHSRCGGRRGDFAHGDPRLLA